MIARGLSFVFGVAALAWTGTVLAAATAPAPELRPGSAAPVAAGAVPVPMPRPDGLAGLSRSDAAWRTTLAFAGSGDWAEAAAVRGRDRDPSLEALFQWTRLRDGNQPTTFAEIERFLHDHPGWPDEATLVARGEELMGSDIGLARRLEWFAKHPPRSTRGRLAHLEAVARTGDAAAVETLARETWRHIELGKRDETLFLNRYGKHLRQIDHIERLDEMLWRGHSGAARQAMDHVPDGWRKLADARLRLRFKQASVDDAIRRVPKDLQDDPGLHYERLRWRRQAGMAIGAREMMFAAPPSSEFAALWWRERAWHIREALDDGKLEDAYLLAASHNQRSGAPFAEAEWLAGWISLRFLDRPTDALRHFTQLHGNVSTPISSARAAYWAGRAAEVLGNPDAAREWYARGAAFQTTFYGQLAAARIGAKRISLPVPAAPDAAVRAAFLADDEVQAARALLRLRMDGTARLFLRHLAVSSDDIDRSALIAEIAAEAGELGTAVFTARRAATGRMILPALGYPLLDPIPTQGPEPAFVHAIIRQESSFEATAISRVGARGLMQLMPATAQATAKSIGLEYDLGSLIARPDYNVRLGSTYLKQMVDRFDGHYIKAIASYNAGPGRVAAWVRAHGDPSDPSVDVIDWIERIPFSETRNYVQRVLEALHVYRERLANDHDQTTAMAALAPGAQKVWCVYSCGVLLDRQQAALKRN
ncbi:lytic transglycosylase domain-containing protein [Thalassobaculum litoreum]|uniref:Soluble lytic murein transglycosylase n=1 Tax=Thalassobaculum litoreum DSM 18839 TaxID=1123362 RepID=A0A8G2EV63_9PROT|nr:lytic transglycosylase domain-containing protein [Thalassobaculum litoreum]SDF15078.1 soluble lytic murein transglycosylase [Thalassobaculum litoreum DSM 18839]